MPNQISAEEIFDMFVVGRLLELMNHTDVLRGPISVAVARDGNLLVRNRWLARRQPGVKSKWRLAERTRGFLVLTGPFELREHNTITGNIGDFQAWIRPHRLNLDYLQDS